MVKFEVKVTGSPKPTTKWLKSGEELTPSEEFQIENFEDGTSILIINDVYPDDTGEIKFEAENPLGVAETVTEFVVEGNEMKLKILLLFLFLVHRKKRSAQICSFFDPFYTFIFTFLCFINVVLKYLFNSKLRFFYLSF